MKKIIILVSLTLFLLVGITVYSQEPSPPVTQRQVQTRKLNSKSSTNSNIKTKDNNNPSQDTTPAVDKNDTNSNKPSRNSQVIIVKDDSITTYTLWLTIFTGLLFGCNILLWLYTRKIASAAQKSAKSLLTIERAYVYAAIEVKKIEPRYDDHGFTRLFDFCAQIVIWNHGKTPAIINKVCGLTCLGKPILAKIEENEIPSGFILGSGGMRSVNAVAEIVNEDQRKAIFNESIGAYCYGRMEYEDVFGEKYTRGFCWETRIIDIEPGYEWVISKAYKKLNYNTQQQKQGE